MYWLNIQFYYYIFFPECLLNKDRTFIIIVFEYVWCYFLRYEVSFFVLCDKNRVTFHFNIYFCVFSFIVFLLYSIENIIFNMNIRRITSGTSDWVKPKFIIIRKYLVTIITFCKPNWNKQERKVLNICSYYFKCMCTQCARKFLTKKKHRELSIFDMRFKIMELISIFVCVVIHIIIRLKWCIGERERENSNYPVSQLMLNNRRF